MVLKAKTRQSLFLILYCLILLAVLELISRVIFPLAEISNFNRILYSPLCGSFHGDQENLRRYWLMNTSFLWISSPDKASYVHHLNLYGFRDKDWTVQKTKPRVMFVGDSFVEGFMSADDATIPLGFAKEAHIHGYDFDVMNMGIGATGPADYVRLVRDSVPIFKPDYLVVCFYANDFPTVPIDSAIKDKRLKPNFSNLWIPRLGLVAWKLLRGWPVPLLWSHGQFQFIPAVPDPVNPLSKNPFIQTCIRPDILQAMKQGHFNPHVINELVGFETMLKTPDPNIKAYVEYLVSLSRINDCKLVLAYIPCSFVVSKKYQEYALAFSESRDIPIGQPAYRMHAKQLEQISQTEKICFLDLTDRLIELENQGERIFSGYDEHMTPQSYLKVGQLIFRLSMIPFAPQF